LIDNVDLFFRVKLFELRVELQVLAPPPLVSLDDVGVTVVVDRVGALFKEVVLLPVVLSTVKRWNPEQYNAYLKS
jgi:hypothetical protein